MFTIEKDLSGIFWHIYNNARTRVNVSDFDVVIDSISQTFIIQCKNGSNIPSQAIAVSLMQVIDLSVGTSPIAFSGAEGLIQLLMAKNYTPYLQDAPSESVYVYRVGQVGVFTMTNQQFIDNFDGTGLGRNTMLGWALRNGNVANGTKNQQGKFSLNKGASPYDVIGAIGGSPNAVLIGHNHKIAKLSGNFSSLGGTAPVSFRDAPFTVDSDATGLSENGVSVPDQTGVGKNMPPYLIDVWVERVTDLVITTGSGGGGGGGVQTVTGVNVTGTATDRVVGVPTFNQVLTEDNQTDGFNIFVNNDDAIQLENGSKLSEGLYDEGTFGNKGIARTCAVGYEDKWEAGEQYITETTSGIIQFRRFAFNVPTVNDDTTKRYAVGSYWQMRNNDIYICTDNTEGAAVWEIYSVAGIPTLQEVLTAGNTTTETAIFGDITADYLSIENNSIGIANSETGESSNFTIGGLQIFDNDNNYAEINFNFGFSTGNLLTGGSYLKNDQLVIQTAEKTATLTKDYLVLQSDIDSVSNITIFSIDKLTVDGNEYLYPTGASSPLATLEDIGTIPTTTSQLTNDGADGVNPFITALDIPVAGEASTLVREVKNMTGATLTKGTVVFISGANGNKALVQKAIATTDALSARTFGLLQSDILNNGLGNCVIIGDLSGINTSSFAEGAQLYLSGTVAGAFTDVRTLAPTHLVYVGKVTRVHPTQGQIEVQIQNGYELEEIHDVQIVTPLNNQALVYETSSELWKNKTIIEDSIVNGVTDKAPSQNAVFDALDFTRKLITNGTGSVTGTTAETILTSLTIPANTLDSKCFIWSTMDYFKSSGSNCTLRLYINTSNSLSGATLIGFAVVGSNRNVSFNRKLYLNGTTLDFLNSNTGATQVSNEFIESLFGASTTLTVNPAANIFLIYTTQNDAVGTTATAKQATVQKLKLN